MAIKNDSEISIIWVDSDPTIYFRLDRFRSEYLHVACFTETADALNALNNGLLKPKYIKCIITSMMERGGRRERGLLNGLEMLDSMKLIWEKASIAKLPLFTVISSTADREQCKQHGVDIVVWNDLLKLQEEVINRLKLRSHREEHHSHVILIGIAGPSGSGKTTYASHLAAKLRSPLKPISLDTFLVKYIQIHHPTLGHIRSSEQPEAINIDSFTTLLRQIRHDWTQADWPRTDSTTTDNDTTYVIVEGFLLFALSNEITTMCDIRIFLDSTQDQCRMQRFRRSEKISSDIPDTQIVIESKFARWFDQLVWSEYLKRRDQQCASAEKVFQSEEYKSFDYSKLDAYIKQRLLDFGSCSI